VPSFSDENNAPVVKKEISNQTTKVGESLSIQLTEHFSDPENVQLTFTATKGEIVGYSLKLTLEEGNHIVGVTASDGENSTTISFSVTVTPTVESPLDTYYQDAMGKEGKALKDALHEIIADHTQLSYAQVWE